VDEAETAQVAPRRRRRWPWILAGLILLVLVALLVAWLMRRTIAADWIEGELERRGVQASYELKEIGFRRQRIENLVIGDPRRPDLTAEWVEIEVSLGIRGRIVGGRITLGQIDRLLPPARGGPFRLPNQVVDVADAGIGLQTPVGAVGFALSGRGNLSNGFNGSIAAVARNLRTGRCAIADIAARGAIRVRAQRPTFVGPTHIGSVSCGGRLQLDHPHFALNVTLNEAFNSWTGRSEVAADAFRTGDTRLTGLRGGLSFGGGLGRMDGDMNLAAVAAQVAQFRTSRVGIDGRYTVSLRSGDFALGGNAAAQGVTIPRPLLGQVSGALRSAAGTPVGPVGAALAAAVDRADTVATARGSLRVVSGGNFGAARFEQLDAVTRSGVRLAVRGGSGITYYWPSNDVRTDAAFALSGGGIPGARFTLNQPHATAPIRGTARIAPMAAGNARLELAEIRFSSDGAGHTRIDTVATVDGPLDVARFRGLIIPVSGHFVGGGFSFGERCVEASVRELQVQSLRVGPATLPLCPNGRALLWKPPGGRVQGGAIIGRPRLAGRLGTSPIALTSDRASFTLLDRSFAASNLQVRLGRPQWLTRLDVGTLSGRFAGRGVGGAFSSLSGRIGNIPLLFSEGRGSWNLAGGDLLVRGGLQVTDAGERTRFHPLVSNDFRLRLFENRITAGGLLRHPASGTAITQASLEHDLSNGVGRAVLNVPGILFDENFQPDAITPLTVGVVALVGGPLNGRGEINWRPGSTTSTGSFTVTDMDLAAPFGPVEGLSTTVNFTDLLNLESAPEQIANVGVVRTGIDVVDGSIRYQILPGQRVRIHAGRWPFAGGELVLQETVLDFSQPSTKRLTFEVIGLQAANFVQQMEFANIAATGTFDGVIPMEFDITGGRITGGRLAARAPGGTLSYVGELSEQQIGVYGNMAFDALRSLRFTQFTITLDGALAGEFLTRIRLDGISRDPSLTGITAGGIRGAVARRALSQLARLPFRFNIQIRGPFRAIIGTARSLEDPTLLIQPVLPEQLRDRPTTVTPIQREESETQR
jgi:hypothetical protein